MYLYLYFFVFVCRSHLLPVTSLVAMLDSPTLCSESVVLWSLLSKLEYSWKFVEGKYQSMYLDLKIHILITPADVTSVNSWLFICSIAMLCVCSTAAKKKVILSRLWKVEQLPAAKWTVEMHSFIISNDGFIYFESSWVKSISGKLILPLWNRITKKLI